MNIWTDQVAREEFYEQDRYARPGTENQINDALGKIAALVRFEGESLHPDEWRLRAAGTNYVLVLERVGGLAGMFAFYVEVGTQQICLVRGLTRETVWTHTETETTK